MTRLLAPLAIAIHLGAVGGCGTVDDAAIQAQKDANAFWAEKVHNRWKAEAEGRYPFVDTDRGEVPLSTFSALFNPVSGSFWKTVEELKKRPLVTFSPEFEAAVEKASRFRAALFKKDGEALTFRFRVLLIQREGVQNIKLSLENEEFEFYDHPDHYGWLNWVEGKSKGAKLSVRVGENQWESLDRSAQQWGPIRLFREGKPRALGEQRFACSWPLEGVARTFAVEAEFETEDKINPFRERFFEEFRCPAEVDKVGP